MDEVYEYNGREYTREQLELKYGAEADDAIAKFGMKRKSSEKEKLKPVELYRHNGKEYSREQLELKYGKNTPKAIEKFGFEPVSAVQEFDNAGATEPQTVKKKVASEPISQDPVLASNGEAEIQPISSDISEESRKYKENEFVEDYGADLQSLTKAKNDVLKTLNSIPEGQNQIGGVLKVVFEEDLIVVNDMIKRLQEQSAEEQPTSSDSEKNEIDVSDDLWNQLKAGAATTAAGLAGVKNFFNKSIASVLMDDEDKEFINSLTPEQREIVITGAFSTPGQVGTDLAMLEAQNDLTDISNKYREKTIQFEGNIITDIGEGNFSQAAYRTLQGAVGSAPSLALALVPGGLVAIGASSASQKQETLEADGADIGIRTALNSTINGVAEAFFEKFTAKIGKSVFKSFQGKETAAKEFSENIVKTILKDVGIEGGSEGLTEVIQGFSDKLVQGIDVSPLQIIKNTVDAAIIGGVMGGGLSAPKALNGYIAAKSMKKESREAITEKTFQAETLEDQASLPEVPEGLKTILTSRADKLRSEVENLQKNELQRVQGMPDEQVKDFFEADNRWQKTMEEGAEIEDSDLPDHIKSGILEEIKSESIRLWNVREELSKSEFDQLPAEERKIFFEQAREQIKSKDKSSSSFFQEDILLEETARDLFKDSKTAAKQEVKKEISPSPDPVENQPEIKSRDELIEEVLDKVGNQLGQWVLDDKPDTEIVDGSIQATFTLSEIQKYAERAGVSLKKEPVTNKEDNSDKDIPVEPVVIKEIVEAPVKENPVQEKKPFMDTEQEKNLNAQNRLSEIARESKKEEFLNGVHEVPLNGLDPQFPAEVKAKVLSKKSKSPNEPIVVGFRDGKATILDGAHRYYEAEQRGDKSIKVRFAFGEGEEQFWKDNSKQKSKKKTPKTRKPKTGDPKTEEIQHGKGTFKVKTREDGRIVIFKKDGTEVKEYTSRKLKGGKTGKVKNAVYSAVYAKATGTMTDNQVKQERNRLWNKVFDSYEPTTAEEIAELAFASGQKVNKESASKETGEKSKELLWATGMAKNSPSVERLGEELAEVNGELGFDSQDYRNAIIDVLMRYQNLDGIRDDIIKRHQESTDPANEEAQRQEMEAFMSGLSPEELSLLEAAEFDDAIDALTTAEKSLLYEHEYAKQIESLPGEVQERIYGSFDETQTQRILAEGRSDGTRDSKKSSREQSPELREVNQQIEKAQEKIRLAETALKKKSTRLDQEILKDQEDIFGDRKSTQEEKLFDERVELDKRAEATAEERQAIKDAKDNLKKLQDEKQRIEEGEGNTGAMEFASDQSRTKNLITERIKPAKRAVKTSPKKLNEIISKVAKDLKSTLIYGRSGRARSLGTYSPRNTLVRIKRAGDLDTVAHELGHYLDDRFNIVGTIPSEMELTTIRQLKWFSDRGGSNPPARLSKEQKRDYLQREGLAELVRAFVVNPTQTELVAPELLQHFKNSIDKKTLNSLKEFSNDYLNIANATAGERILANVEDSNLEDKSQIKEWLDRFKGQDGQLNITPFDKINAHLLNSMGIAEKAFSFLTDLSGKEKLDPSKNFEVMARVFAGINGKVHRALSTGLINGKNQILKVEGGVFKLDERGHIVDKDSGTMMNVKWLMEPLENTSEKTVKNEMNDVIALLVAERTIEYAKKFQRLDDLSGIGAGIDQDIEVAMEFIEDFNNLKENNREKYDRIKEASVRYRKFADAGLKYAVDKGRISKEDYATIKENNVYYAALTRIQEDAPMEESLDFVNEMGGSISSVREIIHKAKGGTGFIQNPYVSLLQNTVGIIRESDRNEVMQSFLEPLSEIRNMGDGNPVNFSQIARPAQAGDKNTRVVYINGQRQNWNFGQDIYKALASLEGVAKNPIVDFMSLPAQAIRFSVTRFPTFALRNAVRDSVSRFVVSRTDSKFKDFIQKADDKTMFEMYGGSQAGFYLINKNSYQETLRSSIKEITNKGGIVLDPRYLGTRYFEALERGENLNRIAEFKSAYRKAKKEGLDDYNAGLYAAYQARDLMDFAVAGHTVRTLNKMVPFLNAGIQGLKRTGKAVKENPGGFAVRTAIYTILPQIFFRALVHLQGDEEEYEQLPAYQRDIFWNFKTPFTGEKWITIPKPFEQGLISSAVDRLYSLGMGQENAFSGFSGTLANSAMPFDQSSMLGGMKPLIEASVNYNMFTERSIVPAWEEGKLLELRSGAKDASRIGEGISKAFSKAGMSVDPRKIDHVIQGYGTYMANWGLSLSEIGIEDSRFKFDASKTGFARGIPISNSVAVSSVYELATELGKWNDSRLGELREDIEAFYESDDKKQREELTKVIYKKAEKLRKEFLSEKKEVLNPAPEKEVSNEVIF